MIHMSENSSQICFQSKGKTTTKVTLGASKFPFQFNMASKNSGKINVSSKNQGNSKFNFQINQFKPMNQLKLGQSKLGQNGPKTGGEKDQKKPVINLNLGQKSDQKRDQKAEQKHGEKQIGGQQGQKTEKKSAVNFKFGGQFDKADGYEGQRWTPNPNQKKPDFLNKVKPVE